LLTTIPVNEESGVIDYELGLLLDAEELTEGGVVSGYGQIVPLLRALGLDPGLVTEEETDDEYSVAFQGVATASRGPG
jgi:hypothetical protein